MNNSKTNTAPLAVFAAVITFISSFFWGIFYPEYSKKAEPVTDIPGLDTAFVPQGSTYFADEDMFVFCGYMSDDTPSRIYTVSEDEVRMITLRREDGSEYGGHAGGITCAGEFVYISNASKLFIMKKDDVLNAKDGDTVTFIGSVPVPCNSSFCSCDGKTLYVGEYHADGYETDETHAITTPDGSRYQALIFGYAISPESEYGLNMFAPVAAWSVCDKVQGFAVTPEGKGVCSISAGASNSEFRFYDMSGKADGEFEINGVKIPLFYLDSGREAGKMTLPRMSEDLECVDGRILVAFEAGAKKFPSRLLPFTEKRAMLVEVN